MQEGVDLQWVLLPIGGVVFLASQLPAAQRNFVRWYRSGKRRLLDDYLCKRPDLPSPNPVRSGPGPEKGLRNLQRRFRAVSR
jgi:hypothetical protein